jgi:hypothetical protein
MPSVLALYILTSCTPNLQTQHENQWIRNSKTLQTQVLNGPKGAFWKHNLLVVRGFTVMYSSVTYSRQATTYLTTSKKLKIQVFNISSLGYLAGVPTISLIRPIFTTAYLESTLFTTSMMHCHSSQSCRHWRAIQSRYHYCYPVLWHQVIFPATKRW